MFYEKRYGRWRVNIPLYNQNLNTGTLLIELDFGIKPQKNINNQPQQQLQQ